jgi:glutathione peroxidase-family protein
MGTIYEFSAKTLDGQEKALSDYLGQVLLVVNTAQLRIYAAVWRARGALP